MSGVFGLVDANKGAHHEKTLSRMGKVLSHRSWFCTDYSTDQANGVYLGRIGIGVFNKIDQPCISEDGRITIFLTGEFYDTEKIRRTLQANGVLFRNDSNIELALRLYQEHGMDFLKKLNGIFLLLIYDAANGQLYLANDRFGLYPIYHMHRNGRFIFGPEVKSILVQDDLQPRQDMVAMAEYFRFQFLLGDKTFFQGIKLLPTGTLLRYSISEDKLQIDRYWDFRNIADAPGNLTFDDAVEEASRLFQQSVDRLTANGYRYGIYLSGGLDSRVILGMMLPKTKPVTVTYGLSDSRDMVLASQISKKLGLSHHRYFFNDGAWVPEFNDLHLDLTEGFHSWIHSHGISILEEVRSLMDVNLTGFGGGLTYVDWEDPVLFNATDDLTFMNRLFDLLWEQTTWPSLNATEENLLYDSRLAPEMQNSVFESFRTELKAYEHLPYRQRAAYFALCNPDRRLFQYYTVFHRAFIEQRFPFYDNDYMEFVYSLPPEIIMKRKLRRAVIRKTMPALTGIPYDKDMLPLYENRAVQGMYKLVNKGKSLVNRNIAPVFKDLGTLNSDYENWLRGGLRDWLEGILFSERTLQRGIFNPDFLRSLWNRQMTGLEVDIVGKIAPMITYELMLRRFIDKDGEYEQQN